MHNAMLTGTLPILLILIVCTTMAQRSPYVPRPVDYPRVLTRFGSTAAPPPLDNRFGSVQPNAAGTLYDQETVDRVATWPKEKQPFWYINSQHIAGHHGLSTAPPSRTFQDNRGNLI